MSYPVYAVGTKWEDYPSEAEQVATIESGTVCVLEAVFGDVDNEDAAAVLQIVEVLRAPEEGDEESSDAESLEDVTARLKGKIVMKRVGANGFLHANSCPLLGTWQYRCNGTDLSYKILLTSRGKVQYVEETCIILKQYAPHESVPGVSSGFIPEWGGHSIKRGNSIFFHMNTDGKLESLYVSNLRPSGFRAVATRIALPSATVVSEGDERTHLKRKRVEVDTLVPVTLPLPSSTSSSTDIEAVVLVATDPLPKRRRIESPSP